MSALSGLGNLNETEQVNLVIENLATADQQLNYQPPVPYLGGEGGSVAHSKYSSNNWESNFSVPSPNIDDIQQPLINAFDDGMLLSPGLEFDWMLRSMAQTEDMNPNSESSLTVILSLGDGESFPNSNEFNSLDNSQREGEDRVQRFEPEQSHMDHAGQASNVRIQKGREPILTPVGKAKSKLHQAETSYPTAMSSLGDGEGYQNANKLPQQLNSLDKSQRDVEDGAGCFETDPSQMDHAGQVSDGRLKKVREPMLTSMEKAKNKLHQAGTSSPTAMSSLGDKEGYPNANEVPQQFNSLDNSQRDVEDGARCSEPEPSHLDHDGQASNGRIPKGRESMLRPVEKAKRTLNQAEASSPTAMSSLGDGEGYSNAAESPQQLNSLDNFQRDVEDGVGCFEPDPSHVDHAGQASNRRIPKDCEPMSKQVEKAKRTLDQIGTSSPKATSSLRDVEGYPNANELSQQFNSYNDSRLRNVEDGVQCFGPNSSNLEHADPGSNTRIQKARKSRLTPAEKGKCQLGQAGTEACTGKKRKAREPMVLTEAQRVERKKKKNDADKKYRRKKNDELNELRSIKQQLDRVMGILSRFRGIDLMEWYNSDLLTPEQKQIVYDNFLHSFETELHQLGQVKSKYGGINKMESMLDKFKELEAMLEPMKSKYGGIENMESMLDEFRDMKVESHKLNQIKYKLGIEETESILEKFKEMEAELHRFDQVKLSFGGGIEEIESGINRLKKIELQFEKHNQMVNQKELESIQASPGSRRQKEADFHRFEQMKSKFGGTEQMELMLDKFHEMEAEINRLKGIEVQVQLHDNHKQKELPFFQEPPGNLQEKSGSQSLDFGDSNMVSDQCGISLNSSTAVRGATPDMQYYSDELVDQLIARVTDENFPSNLGPDSFNDSLEGEYKSVDKFKIPSPLVSTARDILNIYGDIMKESKYIGPTVQTIFVLFCAAIKEMGERSLEEVTEKIIWKWRGPIMDAKRSGFDVEFAMKHLKTIVQGYFGLKARKDRDSLNQRIASLRDDDEALRKELEKNSNETKAVESKLGDLTSKKCKICQESADKFFSKMVGIF